MNDPGILKVCGATKRQGDKTPCKKPAGWGTSHVGFGSCKLHGGSTPASTKHAEGERALWLEHLFAHVDDAMAVLIEIVLDPSKADRDRIAAARDLLDRAGVKVEEKQPLLAVPVFLWPD